ncbi:MAG: hypothetical protein KAS47_07435, partial [Candidatus Heimdallarchaeota archaeon]|nr:hypothetical protein [Candidatus Heimdallarchaeota archaeon]
MPNLKIQKIDVNIERSLAFVNAKTLDKHKIQHSDNIKIKSENFEVMSEVISTETLVEPGFIGLSEELITKLMSKANKKVNVFARKRPASL